MKYVLLLLLLLLPVVAQAQSDTCTDGQSLVIDTVNKRYKCMTISGGALGSGNSITMTVPNAAVTGTTVNRFAKLTGAPSTAVVAGTSDAEGSMGIVISGAGTTGSATIALMGQASCEFDGATTAGNYVVTSATTAGMCHDAGSAFPTDRAPYGRVLSTNGGAGTYSMELMTPDVAFQNAGNGKSRPGGSNTQIQYNDNNQFNGTSDFTFDETTRIVTLSQSNNGRIGWSNSSGSIAFGGFGTAGVGTIKVLSDGTAAGTIYSPETAMTTAGGDPRPFLGLAGQVQTYTLTANKPLGMVGTDGGTVAKDGSIFTLIFIQDGTGSRTITWNSGYKFPGGTAPTLTTTAGAVDIFVFLVSATGTKAYCIGQYLDVR